ncbi:putative peptide modification system cyclase [Lysobacter cavernae]|uniref:Peptide modification system cyclase n=1 Tax=Lysobacter cavernae TaxID=1685901 RepID=A0ABV7RW41_9GAMM
MNEMSHRAPVDVPQLRTLLLTDLCDSTSLVERLGDGPAAELFREHDRLVLKLQQQWRGRLIDRSDGLLLLFERPIDGLGFALDYVRGLRELGKSRKLELKARAGLHVGEVLTWRNSDEAVRVGAKPLEVEGLAKPMAARLMAMARPGQILLSAVAEPLAHRAARELGERGQHLLWKSHGRWRFKGVPDAQHIYEVGEPGIAPLRAPPNTAKVWRDIPLWRRPAALAAEVAVLAVIGVGVWFMTRPQPAIAFNQRDWVVVADLRNLTGQAVLDDSLEQAFRISLEQSRYVNVLSDLKARDTLARMQRKPDTVLDRTIASEIALRDGARAVILPTVAEVGGRVRVSAEVIDPHTQTTVFAETADGTGAVSALGSIDTVTAALREKLGEAIQAIEQDSKPLPQVTTRNLDALKAYALGNQAIAQRLYDEAAQYFEAAVRLDAKFALAHVGLVRIHASDVDWKRARLYLDRALQAKEHLTRRDLLYLDAWEAELGPRSDLLAPAKWKMLATMYPDFHAGHYNYAWGSFYASRFDEALKHARAAAAPQNPLRSRSHELIGRVYLAQGQHAEALVELKRAEAIGAYGPSRRRAAALAAMKRFDEAEAVLASMPPSPLRGISLTNQLESIAILVDQGRLDAAADRSRRAATEAGEHSRLLATEFALIRETVDHLRGKRVLGSTGEVYRRALEGVRDVNNDVDREEQAFIALSAAYLAQRGGDATLGQQAIRDFAPLVAGLGDPNTSSLYVIVQAGQARLAKQPQAAIDLLKAELDGSELFQLHVALRDAYAAAGQGDEVARQADWLQSHRGLAYIEAAGSQVLQAMNVSDTALRSR